MPNLPPGSASGPPPVVAVALPKGGVGKTTSAVNLAAEIARTGRAVLLVDVDSQGHAGDALGLDLADGSPGLGAVLLDPSAAPGAVVKARTFPTVVDGVTAPGGSLDVIPGGVSLANAARDLARLDYGAELALRRALAPVATDYDLVILDTAPGWDALAVACLFAASDVVAPVALDVLALRAFGAFVPRIDGVRAHRAASPSPGPRLAAVLPTFLDGRARAPAEILEQLTAAADALAVPVLPPVRYSARLAEAPGWGETAREIEPTGRAVADYAAAADALASILSI